VYLRTYDSATIFVIVGNVVSDGLSVGFDDVPLGETLLFKKSNKPPPFQVFLPRRITLFVFF
jgi:hypothetical protein